MNCMDMTEIASDVRELTESELAIVAGGSVLGAIKSAASAVFGAIGYLAYGAPGAAAGSILGPLYVDAVAGGPAAQGKLSGEIGFMPNEMNF